MPSPERKKKECVVRMGLRRRSEVRMKKKKGRAFKACETVEEDANTLPVLNEEKPAGR